MWDSAPSTAWKNSAVIRIAAVMIPACLQEVKPHSNPGSINGQHAGKTLLSSVSVVCTVAMIAAAQSDIVIDVEESPILKTVVGNNAYGYRRHCFFLLLLIEM